MSVQISYKKQVFVVFLLLIVFLIVIEGVLRIYDFFNPSCHFMTNEASKNIDYFVKWQVCDSWESLIWYIDPLIGMVALEPDQHHPDININGYGFRGQEISKIKPHDTYRIFLVGGSTAFSVWSVSDQHTITGFLQENFDKQNFKKNIEVINAGIPGYTSTGELILIQNKILDFNPDLIIIYDGGNNLLSKPNKKIKTLPYQTWLNEWNDVYYRYFTFYKTPKIINAVQDQINSEIQKKLPKSTEPSNSPTWTYEEKVFYWKNELLTICGLGKQNGFDTIIVLQPVLGTGNKQLTESEEKYAGAFASELYFGYQLFANELPTLNPACTKTADLRNIFDNIQEPVYFDRVHISSEYNKMVADEIFELALPLTQN